VYRFKPTLAADFESSSLVVSHAGAGSVFEALRAKKPLLVVVNPILADNHQTELADALSCVEGTGHGPHLTWCMADQVSKVLSTFDFKTLKPLPRSDLTKFTSTLDRILR
jgi:beta-1,4-N-acetylglucosaminyltransferase